MDILEKAYDYIDYTLVELSRLEESCVSLLYFFKLFSPAGELAQKILLEHSFIEVENDNNLSVACITDRGREVIRVGGVREYLGHLDEQAASKKYRTKKFRRMLTLAACFAGAVIVTGYALRVAKS